MLRFVFAALVVLLDQLFKRWIVISLEVNATIDLIPGIIGLTRVENTGAAFSILSDQRWLLAGISFIASIVLIFILLRYTAGFWGALGLEAVLDGTVGNLVDRVFSGHVVDMFKPEFVSFAIFNIADIFITLGAITFCIYFIYSSATSGRKRERQLELAAAEYAQESDEQYELHDALDESDYDDFSDTKVISSRDTGQHPMMTPYNDPESTMFADSEPTILADSEPVMISDPEQDMLADSEPTLPANFEPAEQPESIDFEFDELTSLESELDVLDAFKDYDIDQMLREYGFEDDADNRN